MCILYRFEIIVQFENLKFEFTVLKCFCTYSVPYSSHRSDSLISCYSQHIHPIRFFDIMLFTAHPSDYGCMYQVFHQKMTLAVPFSPSVPAAAGLGALKVGFTLLVQHTKHPDLRKLFCSQNLRNSAASTTIATAPLTLTLTHTQYLTLILTLTLTFALTLTHTFTLILTFTLTFLLHVIPGHAGPAS